DAPGLLTQTACQRGDERVGAPRPLEVVVDDDDMARRHPPMTSPEVRCGSEVVTSAPMATIADSNGRIQIHGLASPAATYVTAQTTSATVAPVSTAPAVRNARVGWRRVTRNINGTVSGAATIAPPIETSRNPATQNSATPAALHRGSVDGVDPRFDMREVCQRIRGFLWLWHRFAPRIRI